MAKILIVDKCSTTRKKLSELLQFENYVVDLADSQQDCLKKLRESNFDLIIFQSEMDGVSTLSQIKDMGISIPIIMTIGDGHNFNGDVGLITQCMQYGAADFIVRPFDVNTFLFRVRKILNCEVVSKECKILKSHNKTGLPDIIGSSDKIMHVKQVISKVADTETRVLITGENGTGKELAARWLHVLSRRNAAPFVEINCAAIPDELIESELFGHEKGSFTSANNRHIGKFEQADGGTLFLDEVGDMSLSAQAKVLRALQESKITRVGGTKDVSLNVRVVAATNKNLRNEITKGNFREDLYHRLNVIPLHIPLLRERTSDIPMLVQQFITDVCRRENYSLKKISDEAMSKLQKYEWPGNVRELHNVVDRLVVMSSNEITAADYEMYAQLS